MLLTFGGDASFPGMIIQLEKKSYYYLTEQPLTAERWIKTMSDIVT